MTALIGIASEIGLPATIGNVGSALAPNPPTNFYLYGGSFQVTATWLAPLIGAPTSYTVTLNPGNIKRIVTTTSVVITGLTRGMLYTATIVASNGTADSASVTSNSVTVLENGLAQGQIPVALTSVTTGLLWAWYAANQLKSNPGNGNPLASGNGGSGIFINDASGNGRDVTVAATPPLYRTGFRNSTVTFDFTGTQYFILPFDTTTFNGQTTVFIVADIATYSTDHHILANRLYDGTNFQRAPYAVNISLAGAGAPSVTTDQMSVHMADSVSAITTGGLGTATVWALSCVLGGTAGSKQYFSGTKQASGTLSTIVSNISPLFVGARGNIANISRQYIGRIAELIFFTGALSDTDRHTVETYLGTKYNIIMASQ